MKWRKFIQQSFRDTVLMGFGGWIIWKEVYAENQNVALILVGVAFILPSARAAIISILSGPGSSSASAPSPPELPSPPSSSDGAHERT